jgi:RNA-directed DNA polymerase
MSAYLMEQMASPENLLSAWRAVRGNIPKRRRRHSTGSDGISLEEFERDLSAQLDVLVNLLISGRYQPEQPNCFDLPKPGGGTRQIAVLTVRDRVAQRACQQIIEPIWEPHFLDCSFGFRPGLSIYDAVDAVRELRGSGLRWVVDGDIATCFQSIDHDLMLKLLQKRIDDRRVLILLQRWLDAGVLLSGLPSDAESGSTTANSRLPDWAGESIDWVLNTLAREIDGDDPLHGFDEVEIDAETRFNQFENSAAAYRDAVMKRRRKRALQSLATSGLMLGMSLLRPRLENLGSTAQERIATPAGRRFIKKSAVATGGLAAMAAGSATAAYLLNRRAGPAPAGVLQGSPLSPLLANIYLHPFDVMLTKQRCQLVRYADDWVIPCSTRESAETTYNNALVALKKLHLKPNKEKTSILDPDQTLEWLGQEIK